MKYYFAPMECITGHLFRSAHRKYFVPADKYFSPFIVPGKGRRMNRRETEDILPENNRGICLVPQILTNRAEDFLGAAGELEGYGYREVNLNLGCPSKGVAAKGRGAGFLKDRQGLERFLDAVFEKCPLKISVKTRLGMEGPEEFWDLLELFNRYPLEELIVHPRIQGDFYRGIPRMEYFAWAVEHGRAPLCYNGDLFSAEQIGRWKTSHPTVERIMLGRGLVANPALIGEARGEEKLTGEKLRAFHDELCAGYQEQIGEGEKVLPKMKELWYYLRQMYLEYGKAVENSGEFCRQCGKKENSAPPSGNEGREKEGEGQSLEEARSGLDKREKEELEGAFLRMKRARSLEEYQDAAGDFFSVAEGLREKSPYYGRGVLEGGSFQPPDALR